MSSTRFEKYRKLLEALGDRVGSDANAMAERTRAGSGGNSGAELSNAPLHLGDMGTALALEETLGDQPLPISTDSDPSSRPIVPVAPWRLWLGRKLGSY